MLAVSITSKRTTPDSRPTTPAIGGRSVSKVPWPRRLLARRRGGSAGAAGGVAFFPPGLGHLGGLGHFVVPWGSGPARLGPAPGAEPPGRASPAVASHPAR